MTELAINVPAAARRAGVGRSTVYKWMKSGLLKPRKAGTRTLIIVSELDALIMSLPAADLQEAA